MPGMQHAVHVATVPGQAPALAGPGEQGFEWGVIAIASPLSAGDFSKLVVAKSKHSYSLMHRMHALPAPANRWHTSDRPALQTTSLPDLSLACFQITSA